MPGICGLFSRLVCDGNVTSLLTAMMEELVSQTWHRSELRMDSSGAGGFGVVTQDNVRRRQVAWDAGSASGLVLDGELYSAPQIKEPIEGMDRLRRQHGIALLVV